MLSPTDLKYYKKYKKYKNKCRNLKTHYAGESVGSTVGDGFKNVVDFTEDGVKDVVNLGKKGVGKISKFSEGVIHGTGKLLEDAKKKL